MFRVLFLILAQIAIQDVLAAKITVSSFAQVPTTAAGLPVPSNLGYRLQSFGDGAYMVTDGGYQSTFFVACDSVIAVDAPPTIGENVLRAIRSITNLPVSHVVYSHHHADHIGGAYLFNSSTSNLTIIAHQLTAKELAMTPDYSHRPAPDITFDSSYDLHVCNQTLELSYLGPNHDPGNIFIYAKLQKVLMLVDIVYPGWIPFFSLAEAQDVPGFIKAHDQILSYDFDHFVGGHLDRSGVREDVVISREYVIDLLNTAELAINMSAETNSSLSVASVITPTVDKVDPNNFWALFDTYIDVLSQWVTEQMAPKWNKRLYGFGVYAPSHATAMLEAVRLDWGVLGPYGVTNAKPENY